MDDYKAAAVVPALVFRLQRVLHIDSLTAPTATVVDVQSVESTA